MQEEEKENSLQNVIYEKRTSKRKNFDVKHVQSITITDYEKNNNIEMKNIHREICLIY